MARMRSVGSEHDTVDRAAVTEVQCPDQAVASHVPKTYGPVVAVSRREGPAIGTVGDAVDEVTGLQRDSERLAARYVPQHDGSSDVSGRNAASIGTECKASDSASMIVERPDQPVAADVPQLDRAVGARSRQYAPVGTERDAIDGAGVRSERGAELPASRRVPEANRTASLLR